MIRRIQYGRIGDETNFEVTCDDCGDGFEVETGNFQDAIAEIKSQGWRITKEDGEWVHYCPDCKDQF